MDAMNLGFLVRMFSPESLGPWRDDTQRAAELSRGGYRGHDGTSARFLPSLCTVAAAAASRRLGARLATGQLSSRLGCRAQLFAIDIAWKENRSAAALARELRRVPTQSRAASDRYRQKHGK